MCCGNKRAALALNRASMAATGPGRTTAAGPASATSVIVFEYVGASAPATVAGPVSGRAYRFAQRGERIAVDARDRPGLLALPALRWVR